MPTWTFYRLDTGEILGKAFTGPERLLEMNTPAGCGAIEGAFDNRARRVVSGVAAEWQPPQPPDTHNWTHEWSPAENRWLRVPSLALARRRAADALKAQIVAEEAGQTRTLRELLLAQADGTPAAAAVAQLRASDSAIRALRERLQAVPAMSRADLK